MSALYSGGGRRPGGSRARTLTAATFLVSLLALAGACKESSPLPISTAKRTIADSADQVMFGSSNLITDRGVLRAEVRSDTSFFFDENTRLEMRIVHGFFYSSMGAKEAVLTSRAGLYNTRIGMLEARGDVVITSTDGRRLVTPFVRYDQRMNQVSSESTFVLTEPGRELKGIGFVSDPDLQNVHVKHMLHAKTGAVAVPEQ